MDDSRRGSSQPRETSLLRFPKYPFIALSRVEASSRAPGKGEHGERELREGRLAAFPYTRYRLSTTAIPLEPSRTAVLAISLGVIVIARLF
ncbi:hypothetical protein MRX96_046380 [Rhipicephalus microplus]